jgi:hypothetical protein
LESLVDRQLKRLPQPRAPRTLLPRVMAATAQWTARPWYARAWSTWPQAGQVAAAVALVLVVAGAAWTFESAQATLGVDVGSDVAAATTRTATDVSLLFQRAEATANAVRVVWLALAQPVAVYALGSAALYAFVFVALMSSACLFLGTALNRVVFGKAFQS